MLLLAFPTAAQLPIALDNPTYNPDEVKSVFLYHFGTYVEWPNDASDTLTIAVLGAEGFAETLQTLLIGRTIDDRPVRARAIGDVSELTDEQILFIGASKTSGLDEMLPALEQRPILVVTDSPDGLRKGAIINFLVVDEHIRFEIALGAARSAGLTLSSRLLSAALRVEPQ
jgi:hypothetical protein